MKKILTLITIAMLAMSACSSDDDDIKGGGDDSKTKGNSWTNPAKRTVIPADELKGKWVFNKRSYTIECGDNATYKKIENDLLNGTSNDLYPRTGYFTFHPKEANLGINGMYPEGSIRTNYTNMSETGEYNRPFGDYFTNQDTIFYYHWTLKDKYAHMLKKGDRLYYHYDNTQSFKARNPNGNVRNVVYYAEYVKAK